MTKQELIKENEKLISEVVFLTKQVANREKTIMAFEELSKLGISTKQY